MVEKELKKNPDISNTELRDKAAKIDSRVEKLTPRQFNARYPLQVKREMNPAKRTGKRLRRRSPPRRTPNLRTASSATGCVMYFSSSRKILEMLKAKATWWA